MISTSSKLLPVLLSVNIYDEKRQFETLFKGCIDCNKDKRICDNFDVNICGVVWAVFRSTVTCWLDEKLHCWLLSYIYDIIIFWKAKSFYFSNLALICVDSKCRDPKMINLIKVLRLESFQCHHDSLAIDLISLSARSYHKHEIHIAITALCNIYILEIHESLELANRGLLDSCILEVCTLYLVMSGIHRPESCLAQGIRFNHLLNTVFLSKTKSVVRL